MASGTAATAFMLAIATSVAMLATAASSADLPPYTNHTVGGDAGWVYNQKAKAPATEYTAWAGNQSFFLGDYLIFNTNGNSSVIQTYNATTYKNCAPDQDDTTTDYSGAGGTASAVPVPLTQEGDTYFLSGTFDDAQCQDGMKFQIKVGKGRGLPPELNQPPPPPYVAPGPPPAQQQEAVTTPGTQQQAFHKDGSGGPRKRVGLLGLVFTLGLVLVIV